MSTFILKMKSLHLFKSYTYLKEDYCQHKGSSKTSSLKFFFLSLYPFTKMLTQLDKTK